MQLYFRIFIVKINFHFSVTLNYFSILENLPLHILVHFFILFDCLLACSSFFRVTASQIGAVTFSLTIGTYCHLESSRLYHL